jgi:uncharacterized protein (TIGR03437 family)
VAIEVKPYVPGVKQMIRVRITHPEARRWGFQLTARLASDETKPAGTFNPTGEVRVTCASGTDAPCNGETEFAEHTTTSTRQSQFLSSTWEVEWTPPATDVGEVVFYAAGNAADNSLNNQGDRIFTTNARAGTCSLTARPTITAVVNGGSFDATLAPSAMATLYGSNFAAAGATPRLAGFNDFDNGNFGGELGCIAVEIGGKRAPITYIQGNQVNVQVPHDVPAGPVDVRVILNPGRPNEVRGDARTVQVQRYAPAFFSWLPTRSIIGYFPDTQEIVGTGQGRRAARPGEVVTLFGTGFGPLDRDVAAGHISPEAATLRDRPTITIGGVTLSDAEILYAGLAGNAISALYQFNLRIPNGVPDGDVPVIVTVGGVSSPNYFTILVRR